MTQAGREEGREEGREGGEGGRRGGKKRAGHQCLPPLLLATQEAEIRRIPVRSQPRQILRETLFQKRLSKKRVEWLKVKALSLNPSPTTQQQKRQHRKRGGRVAQVLKCLPSKRDALRSNSSTSPAPKKSLPSRPSHHGVPSATL
jgi:hypothetical protein